METDYEKYFKIALECGIRQPALDGLRISHVRFAGVLAALPMVSPLRTLS
jgi:hypothetical protein